MGVFYEKNNYLCNRFSNSCQFAEMDKSVCPSKEAGIDIHAEVPGVEQMLRRWRKQNVGCESRYLWESVYHALCFDALKFSQNFYMVRTLQR